MWSWLTKIDPNVVIPTVLTLGTWLYHRIAGAKHATQADTIGGIVRSILAEIIDHVPSNVPISTYLTGARDYVEKRIWNVLPKRGIPDNALTRGLVHAAIEKATAELATEIAAERRKKAGTS